MAVLAPGAMVRWAIEAVDFNEQTAELFMVFPPILLLTFLRAIAVYVLVSKLSLMHGVN
jgi:hypothetical protein